MAGDVKNDCLDHKLRQTVVTALRKKPSFDINEANESIRNGSIIALISIGVSIAFIFLILLAIKEKIFTIGVFIVLCFTPVMIIQSFMSIRSVRDGISTIAKKNNWLKDSVVTQTTIADHKEIFYERSGYEDSYSIYKLALDMIPSQSKINSGESVVWAQVNKTLYERYVNINIISIHYSKEDPFTFLIDGE